MKKLLILLAFAATVVDALAQRPDAGAWGSLQLSHRWNNGWYANLRGEYRQRGPQTDIWFIRSTVGRRLTPWLQADVGLDRFATPSSLSLRAILSVTFSLRQGPLTASLRQRYIPSRNVHTGAIGHLLRSQLKVSYAIPSSIATPYMAVEVYGWEHWRQTHHFAGTRLRLGDQQSLDLFYLYGTYASKPEMHALGVGYELSF